MAVGKEKSLSEKPLSLECCNDSFSLDCPISVLLFQRDIKGGMVVFQDLLTSGFGYWPWV